MALAFSKKWIRIYFPFYIVYTHTLTCMLYKRAIILSEEERGEFERRNLRPLTASDRVDNSQNVGKLFIYKGEIHDKMYRAWKKGFSSSLRSTLFFSHAHPSSPHIYTFGIKRKNMVRRRRRNISGRGI